MESRRSAVRVYVTYAVTLAYVLAAGFLIVELMDDPQQTDVAIGIFAGLSSVATGVVGFWFGNRKAIQEIQARPPGP